MKSKKKLIIIICSIVAILLALGITLYLLFVKENKVVCKRTEKLSEGIFVYTFETKYNKKKIITSEKVTTVMKYSSEEIYKNIKKVLKDNNTSAEYFDKKFKIVQVEENIYDEPNFDLKYTDYMKNMETQGYKCAVK